MALSLSFGKHCRFGVTLLPSISVPLKHIAFYTTLKHRQAKDSFKETTTYFTVFFVRFLLKARATELSNF